MAKQLNRLATLLTSCMVALSCGFFTASLAKDSIPDHLFISHKVPITYPPAPPAAKDQLITPPGEESFYPIRSDGQPYVVNVDRTVNLTAAVNAFYYNPKWRGEIWTPFDQFEQAERLTRMMSTYREYDEFSILRVLNGVNKWFEKWSGFGP